MISLSTSSLFTVRTRSIYSFPNTSFSSSSNGNPTFPTPLTNATISTPYASLRNFSAMAPAATRPIVSRAEARPPPDEALTPYLAR